VCPVRVQAHAFAPGMPHRFLLISPDHAVYWHGALIPVRYLINGATIRQAAAAEVVYYHVELDAHDILLAEGLPAESYLDTGNRSAFANGGGAVLAHADFALGVWQREACAPLVAAGPKLALAKRHLLDRAAALGHAQTGDPDLRLLADGRPVHATRDGAGWRVRLPRGARSVRVLSRGFVPAQLCIDGDDHRRLGVAIGALAIDGRALALDDPRLITGWHACEATLRWTDGDAAILVEGARDLELHLALAGLYWQDTMAAIVPGRAGGT
jgi:hypothetical protein